MPGVTKAVQEMSVLVVAVRHAADVLSSTTDAMEYGRAALVVKDADRKMKAIVTDQIGHEASEDDVGAWIREHAVPAWEGTIKDGN